MSCILLIYYDIVYIGNFQTSMSVTVPHSHISVGLRRNVRTLQEVTSVSVETVLMVNLLTVQVGNVICRYLIAQRNL